MSGGPPFPRPGCAFHARGVSLRHSCEVCADLSPGGLLRLERGTILYVEGARAAAIFPIVSGFLREIRTLPDGRVQALRLLRPGDAAGLEALNVDNYSNTIECLTSASVCRIPKAEAQEVLQAKPQVALPLVRLVQDDAAQLADAMVWLGQGTAEERVLAFLRHVLAPYPAGAAVRLPITRGEIAEFLGLGLTTVSRMVQRLARAGKIEVKGRTVRLLAEAD